MKQLPENVKRRIAALRKMAEDTSSENEAMIAARQLHALLTKYGIEEFELEADGDTIDMEEVEINSGQLGTWAGIIAQSIANLYFCCVTQTPVRGRGKEKHRVFSVHGSNNYRITATLLIKNVLRVVDSAARASSKEATARGEYAGYGHIVSFRNGAAQRIAERCRELKRAAQQGTLQDEEGRNLPVMLSLYESEATRVVQYLQERYGGKLRKSTGKSTTSDKNAYFGGRAYGDSVQLTQSLEEQAKSRLLGRG